MMEQGNGKEVSGTQADMMEQGDGKLVSRMQTKKDRKVRKMSKEEQDKEKAFYEDLGKRMFLGRYEIKKTQGELGSAMFVNDNTYSNYEHGEAKPKPYGLKLFCEATGVEPNDLFGYSGKESTSTELRIMAILKEMPEADKKKLLSVLEVLYPTK